MSTKMYSLDKEFLDRWSPKMAYVLGFWFADGYMRHEKSYRIVFTSKDYRLLLQIRNCLGSNHPIYQRKDGTGDQLIVFSKQIYLKLLALGGKRCKSKTIRFPQVPHRYLPDFIRGYFDGDGSVFYTTYYVKKKPRTELRSNFTSGSPKFLKDLQNAIANDLGTLKRKICSYNKGVSWKLGYGTENTLKLLKFMYYDGYPIGLERKAVFLKKE